MERKKLPLGKPIVSSYYYESYPLSILDAYGDKYLPWIFSNYINLNVNIEIEKQQDLFLAFYGPLTYDCPFLKSQKVFWSSFESLGIDIHTYIKNNIEKEYYLYFQVDWYYIPNRTPYNKEHFLHDLMVHGYDNTRQIYYVSGYDIEGTYRESEVTFDAFEQAFKNNLVDKIEESWADRIFLFQYDDKAEYKFNYELVKLQIKDYLNSENSFEKYNRFIDFDYSRERGINVYDIISKYLSLVKKGDFKLYGFYESLDQRVFKICYEHKNIMLQRLNYINENIKPVNDILEEYKKVHALTEQCYFMCIKYNITKKIATLDNLTEKVNEIKKLELYTLGKLFS